MDAIIKKQLEDLLEDYGDGDKDPGEFIDDMAQLIYWLKLEIETNKAVTATRKERKDSMEQDRKALYKPLRNMDHRMATYIHGREVAIFGRSKQCALTKLELILEEPMPKEESIVHKVRYSCALMVAGYCVRWDLTLGAGVQCGFHQLMLILMSEIGVSWAIRPLAVYVISIHQKPDF